MTRSPVAHAFLEYDADGALNHVEISRLPFRVGRDSGSDYIIASRHVSKSHAEFFLKRDQLHVRDLGSTNGTFVNGAAIKEVPLQHGDTIYFATHEFRILFGAPEPERPPELLAAAPGHDPFYQELLREILREKTVRTVFQPVVRLRDKSTVGYEALGRVIADDPKISTSELFSVADLCESASDLSRIFRNVAFRDAVRIPGDFYFFVNVHPEELTETYFLSLLKENLFHLPKRCRVVLEIRQDAMVDAGALRRFQQLVQAMGVKVAFDDFDSVPSCLTELAQAPPDFIKFDMKLMRRLDQGLESPKHLDALRELADRRKIVLIAKGIETVQDAAVCSRLGFEFGQGYLLGRPQSISLFVKSGRTEEVDLGPIFREVARKNT